MRVVQSSMRVVQSCVRVAGGHGCVKTPMEIVICLSPCFHFDAIEEALCNAVYHHSYEVREPIEVRILPDRITVTSFPGPDRSIQKEDMEQYHFLARRYRNRRIGELLKELDLTEGRGTGIPKILRKVEANGSPIPRFLTDDDRTYFIVEFPIHPDFLPKNIIEEKSSEKRLKKGSEKKAGKISIKASVKGLEKKKSSEKNLEKGSEKNLDDSYNKILILIQKTPNLTIRELSEELNISTRSIEKHINTLKKAGKLKRMGSRKEGWWKVM